LNNKTKIYFIGRKQGIGIRRFRLSHLENRRRFESDGLRDACESIEQTRWVEKADVVWVRVRPEHTTDRQRYLIDRRLEDIRKKIPIINDISIFDNYDCKDRSFQLWKDHSVPCPAFLNISTDEVQKNFDQTVETISKFINDHRSIFLRTNNETASLGIHILTSDSTKNEIGHALNTLILRCVEQQKLRSSTRVMAVQFIDSGNGSEYQDLYRVHVLFGKVLSFYAVTSKKAVFHNVDMDDKDIDRFISLNEGLCKRMVSIEHKVLSAVRVLGCNLGAIEFFLVNDRPVFIELNPMWGGHASINGFGNKKVQIHLIENRKNLEKRIPNIYNFMDRRSYYKNLYEAIHDHLNHSDH